jgi:hypothetical protein
MFVKTGQRRQNRFFLEENLSLAFILRGQNKALGLKVSKYHSRLLFGGILQDDIQMQKLLVYNSIFFGPKSLHKAALPMTW